MLKINFKNPLVVFGILIVIFFGYWLIFGQSSNNFAPTNATINSNNQTNNNPASSGSLDWLTNASGTKFESYDSSSQNLTDLFSKNMSSDFVSKLDFSKATSSPQTFIDQLNSINNLNSDQIASFFKQNPLGLVDTFSDKDIKIINDNSDAAIKNYGQQYSIIFSQAGGILDNNQDKFAQILSDAIDNSKPQDLDQLILDLGTGFDKMKALEVPSNLADFHKKNLALFKNISIVLKAVRNGDSDPLAAYIATQDGIPKITQEINDVNTEFSKLSSKYKF